MTLKNQSSERITLEDLRFYVPIFQKADEATRKLEEEKELSNEEKARLYSIAGLKDLAVRRIAFLSNPLITRELNKIIASSHLKGQGDPSLFHILYYAGISGLEKGLRKFDLEKMSTVSSTNYIFQWITVYAKKELLTIEAPMGVAPSRFQRHKKISAVRKRMTDEYGREPTDEEVYEYFQSGRADQKNFNGRKKNSGKPSEANRKITLDLIREQKEIEKNLHFAPILDVAEDFRAERIVSTLDKPPFSQTIFGSFVESRNFTDESIVVLKSELHYELDFNEAQTMGDISDKDYKFIASQWRDLMRSKNGIFHEFLKTIPTDSENEFDVKRTLSNINSHGKVISESKFKNLFKKERLSA